MATAVDDFTGTNTDKIDKLIQAVVGMQATMRTYAIVGYILIPTLVPATFGLTAYLVTQTSDAKQEIAVVNTRLGAIEKRLDKVEDRLDKMDDKLDKLDSRLDNIEQTLAKINAKLDNAPSNNK